MNAKTICPAHVIQWLGLILFVSSGELRVFAEGCVAAPQDLIAWWAGDGNANDRSGNHDGVLINGVLTVAGKVGQTLSFDGINDFVQVPDSPVWAFGTREFTIELWANFAANAGTRVLVASDTGSGVQNKWIFWVESGLLRFYIVSTTDGDANIGTASFSPALGQWYHLALTRAGSDYIFYLDGSAVSINSDTRPVPDANAPLTIGQAENNFYFGGLIDEVAIYNRALTGDEIRAIYNAGSAGKCKPQVRAPEVVWITPGTFVMGSPNNEVGHGAAEEPLTTVTISRGFGMAKYEVTQGEYLSLIGTNPSVFTGNLSRPVEGVSWEQAVAYCEILTDRERSAGRLPAGYAYRLPTEAEWEYACRAGTTTRFNLGDSDSDLARAGWYVGNSTGRTHEVGQKVPNAWGFYDMHGNVWEFCSDWWFNRLPGDAVTDPRGPSNGSVHVVRGGCVDNSPLGCRSAERSDRGLYLGFRVVLAGPFNLGDVGPLQAPPPTQPTYSSLPPKESGKDSLVVITHGRIERHVWEILGSPPDQQWVDSMALSISNNLVARGSNDWQFIPYKWLQNAWTFKVGLLGFGPDVALLNATREGANLGYSISTQGWKHVHLIGHSAGAALIQTATYVIKIFSTNTVVHTTFLDAYTGGALLLGGFYGQSADWADSYFTHDDETLGGWFAWTEEPLDYAYNVEVTWLDTHKIPKNKFCSGKFEPCSRTVSSHGWPIDFYLGTITNGANSNYQGRGFSLSKEGGNWDYATNHYTTGNKPPYVLGTPDTPCSDCPENVTTIPWYVNPFSNLNDLPFLKSAMGTVEKNQTDCSFLSGSPAWLALGITVTNPTSFVSFDATFTSSNGSAGLFSVYWNTNTIGVIDERVALAGLQRYIFPLPGRFNTGDHVLGFRLDPFTPTSSSITVTNVATGFTGVTGAFSLKIGSTLTNGMRPLTLNSPAGYNYSIEASADLTNWTTIAMLVNTDGTVNFFDAAATNFDKRFYRPVGP